jgi:hypothetical protein
MVNGYEAGHNAGVLRDQQRVMEVTFRLGKRNGHGNYVCCGLDEGEGGIYGGDAGEEADGDVFGGVQQRDGDRWRR